MSTLNSLSNIPAGVWNADASHSEVSFTVRHAGISKVRGQFKEFTAQAVVEENPTSVQVNADIDTASFDSGNEGRDQHVRSADFFDVEVFPSLKFVSTSIVDEDGELKMHGNLTLKETTLPVTLDVEVNGVARDPFGLLRVGLEAKTVISRKAFGLTWNAALAAGGVLVSDKVNIELDLSFIHEEEKSE